MKSLCLKIMEHPCNPLHHYIPSYSQLNGHQLFGAKKWVKIPDFQTHYIQKIDGLNPKFSCSDSHRICICLMVKSCEITSIDTIYDTLQSYSIPSTSKISNNISNEFPFEFLIKSHEQNPWHGWMIRFPHLKSGSSRSQVQISQSAQSRGSALRSARWRVSG